MSHQEIRFINFKPRNCSVESVLKELSFIRKISGSQGNLFEILDKVGDAYQLRHKTTGYITKHYWNSYRMKHKKSKIRGGKYANRKAF